MNEDSVSSDLDSDEEMKDEVLQEIPDVSAGASDRKPAAKRIHQIPKLTQRKLTKHFLRIPAMFCSDIPMVSRRGYTDDLPHVVCPEMHSLRRLGKPIPRFDVESISNDSFKQEYGIGV